jgi:hypothetical protein
VNYKQTQGLYPLEERAKEIGHPVAVLISEIEEPDSECKYTELTIKSPIECHQNEEFKKHINETLGNNFNIPAHPDTSSIKTYTFHYYSYIIYPNGNYRLSGILHYSNKLTKRDGGVSSIRFEIGNMELEEQKIWKYPDVKNRTK